jgi:fucose 4-O-acetylase-like acetyltransferase
MKKRLEYIDQIRGLAIILVVIGHIIQFNDIQGGMKNSVFNVIYSFHMPLFFFISGYIGYKTIKIIDFKSLRKHLLNKTISLLIPLFSWSILVNKFFLNQEWNSITTNDIINTITNPSLWFFKILFEIFFFYGFFVLISSLKNKNNNFLKDILIFLFILVLTIGYSIITENKIFSSLLLYTLFFYMAVFISKNSFIEKLIMNEWVFGLSFILFIILCGHWKIGGTIYDDILKLIISIFSFITILNLTIKFKWNSFVSKQVMTFGQYSLGIYVIQFYLAKLTINSNIIFFNNMNPILLFFICLIISIPICYISVWTSKLIELNSILNFILLGKKINSKVKIN